MNTYNFIPLDTKVHREISVQPDNSFAHAKNFNLVNIGFNELASLSGCLPIVVVNDEATDKQSLAGVVGFETYGNLFCSKNQWQGHAVPLSVQTYPFNFAIDNNKVTVLIDDSSDRVQDKADKEYALFSSDGEPTHTLKHYQACLSNLIEGQQQARTFITILKQHDLLSPLSVTLTLKDGQTVTSTDLLSINEEKFAKLDEATIVRFHQQGIAMAINAMLLSLRQYNRLVQLTQRFDNPAEKVGIKLSQ